MKKFRMWLNEAISATASDAVNKIIQRYLQRKLGGKVYKMPGVEEYKNTTGRGYGVRYFFHKNKSIRFNWKGANISAFTLSSVDVWDGTGTGGSQANGPQWHMEFDGQVSLVKTLPTIVDLLKSGFVQGTLYAIPENLNEENDLDNIIDDVDVLNEARTSIKDHFELILGFFKPGQRIDVASLQKTAGAKGFNIYKSLREKGLYVNLFRKEGKTVIFTGTDDDIRDMRTNKHAILTGDTIGATKITITPGPSKETYEPLKGERQIEAEGGIEKVAFVESLRHLSILMKLIIKGASNALFVAGRGGTGKTHTVEEELAKGGMREGDGYLKIAGTATPYGIYTALFNNRKGIVLFDDCDSALADQEGRNIIKAATDTKKVRKISWNKKSGGIIPAERYDELSAGGTLPVTDEKTGNPLYPNSFEFTGRVVFISNLKLDKLDPDKALRTRGYIIDIDPTDAELIDHMEFIAHKIPLENGGYPDKDDIKQVIAEIRKSKNKNDISLRKLVRGLNIKSEMGNDGDWKTILRLYG